MLQIEVSSMMVCACLLIEKRGQIHSLWMLCVTALLKEMVNNYTKDEFGQLIIDNRKEYKIINKQYFR